MVGVLHVHPHKHDANEPPQKDLAGTVQEVTDARCPWRIPKMPEKLAIRHAHGWLDDKSIATIADSIRGSPERVRYVVPVKQEPWCVRLECVGLRRKQLFRRNECKPELADANHCRRRDDQRRRGQRRQSFAPNPATLPVGQMVVWHNVDSIIHS
jgi:hypothetical protein